MEATHSAAGADAGTEPEHDNVEVGKATRRLQQRRSSHAPIRSWLVGDEVDKDSERWNKFQESLITDSADAASLEAIGQDLEKFGLQSHTANNSRPSSHIEPMPRLLTPTLQTRPHTVQGLPSEENTFSYTDRFGATSSRPRSFFAASAGSGLPNIVDQARSKSPNTNGLGWRPSTSNSVRFGNKRRYKARSPSKPVYAGGSRSHTKLTDVTYKASDTAAGGAWKAWFKKQSSRFRSFAVKMQVAMEEARRSQQRSSPNPSSESDALSTVAPSSTFLPSWTTTKLLVDHLHALGKAPGEFGEIQRYLNREIFRCIFFDFSTPTPTPTGASSNQPENGDNQDAALASGNKGPNLPCRRTFFEMVFLLQARFKRLQAKVRFFLVASQETGDNSRKLGKRLVFNAWKAHTERMRRSLIDKLKRRMLGIWWKTWRTWHAEQKMAQRIQRLTAELKRSINIHRLLQNTPHLLQLCATDHRGTLRFDAKNIAVAVFQLAERTAQDIMADTDAFQVIDAGDMHTGIDWLGKVSAANVWTTVLASQKSTEVASTQTEAQKASFGSQTLASVEGYGGGVSHAGNSHGPTGNAFHADVSARLFPILGGILQVLSLSNYARASL